MPRLEDGIMSVFDPFLAMPPSHEDGLRNHWCSLPVKVWEPETTFLFYLWLLVSIWASWLHSHLRDISLTPPQSAVSHSWIVCSERSLFFQSNGADV